MTFEEKVLRDRALANGENPDDPEVNARIKRELAESQEEPEESILSPNEVNALYNEVVAILTNLEGHIVKPEMYGNMSLLEMFANQATNLSLDLIAVDGYIQPEEAMALNAIFDLDFTVQDYVEFYQQRDKETLLDVKFRMVFVPQAYYVAVAADRALFGGRDYFTVKVMRFFLELIKTVTTIDGQFDSTENSAINLFSLAFKKVTPGDAQGYVYVK